MLKSDFPRACWRKEFELRVKTVNQKQNFFSVSYYQFSPIDVGKKAQIKMKCRHMSSSREITEGSKTSNISAELGSQTALLKY